MTVLRKRERSAVVRSADRSQPVHIQFFCRRRETAQKVVRPASIAAKDPGSGTVEATSMEMPPMLSPK